ncbi:hypothetical protein PZA11_004048 [Diplocarpon coronariae]
MKLVVVVSRAACLVPLALAGPVQDKRALALALAPTVQLQHATVVGSSLLGIDSFKGIPYAQPPIGQLRLKPPQPITSNLGTVQAIGTARACPQFYTSTNTSSVPSQVLTDLFNSRLFQTVSDAGEDCLTVTVQRPSSARAGSNLPVVFWMFGGGFEFGSTQIYDGSSLVRASVAQKKDVIYVAVNYRIKKDGSSNLGYLDQRAGLEWVADNIAAFGGDPAKVTIWGESAGSISVFGQMSLYNGDHTYKGRPLFRGGIMDSGSIVPTDRVDGARAQGIYDAVVAKAGCARAADTLACLRGVDYETFLDATTSVPGIFDYSSVALSYLPRPDGRVLTDSAEILAANGLYAQVPFIIGDQEDEGTLFSLVQSNLSTTADLVGYLKDVFFLDATQAQIETLVATYPDDPSAGSPFRTGRLNNIYPQYKRLAAILGDLTFTLTRRVLLKIASDVHPTVPTWSYLSSYFYGAPILGTFHASDILPAFGITAGTVPSKSIQAFYLSFINTLDPNNGTAGLPAWPQWRQGQQLMHFEAASNSLTPDNFRQDSYEFVLASAGSLHV